MAENWSALQLQIAQDLKAEGMTFAIKRKPEAVFDPVLGQYIESGEQQAFTAHGIFKSITTSSIASSAYTFAWQEGVTIQKGDKIVLLDCSTYTPALEDHFILSGMAWAVKAWSLIEPGGTPLLQYVLLRRVAP